MEHKKMIKEDINFLEYPNWVIDRKSRATVWKTEKEHGKYEVLSPLGLPKHFDKIVLYFLLYKLYREKSLDNHILVTSRYEIARNIFDENHLGKNIYDRVMLALRKWQSISIKFEGLFYDEEGYGERYFSIVEEVRLKRNDGELKVRFNEAYIQQLKETKFYKLIDFEQYKKLHKTSSARIYEILVKNFKERNEWAINIQMLAEKLTFEKRDGAKEYYPSDILRRVKPSIHEINKKTDLEIGFNYNKDTGTCIFKKLKKQKNIFAPAIKDNSEIKKIKNNKQKEIAACMVYFNSLEEAEKQRIRNKANIDPYLVVINSEEERIYGYMTNNNQWQPLKNQ